MSAKELGRLLSRPISEIRDSLPNEIPDTYESILIYARCVVRAGIELDTRHKQSVPFQIALLTSNDSLSYVTRGHTTANLSAVLLPGALSWR